MTSTRKKIEDLGVRHMALSGRLYGLKEQMLGTVKLIREINTIAHSDKDYEKYAMDNGDDGTLIDYASVIGEMLRRSRTDFDELKVKVAEQEITA